MKMKDVRPYSVWTLSYTKRYYLTHPWVWFRHVWCNLRAAYWRSKYGFCPTDVFEFGYWFLDVIPQMLKYLAKNAVGYPGNDNFPTPESWENHLLSIVNLLENARDEVRDQKNEYAKEFYKFLDSKTIIEETDENGNKVHKIAPAPVEVEHKYFKRDMELAEEQDVMIEEALKLLAETPLKALWDQKRR